MFYTSSFLDERIQTTFFLHVTFSIYNMVACFYPTILICNNENIYAYVNSTICCNKQIISNKRDCTKVFGWVHDVLIAKNIIVAFCLKIGKIARTSSHPLERAEILNPGYQLTNLNWNIGKTGYLNIRFSNFNFFIFILNIYICVCVRNRALVYVY